MQVIKVLLLPMAAILVTACAAPESGSATTELSAPPVQLHALDDTPGCFIQPDSYFDLPSTPAQDMVSQQREIRAMQASFETQYAQLLTKQVLEDPTALSWEEQGENHLFQGDSIARGDGWGILALSFTSYGPGGEHAYIGAELHYAPASTKFVFEFTETTFGSSYYQRGALVRGCDPESGISFESGPWLIDGQIVDDVLLCWEGDPNSPMDHIQSDEDYEASLSLRCQLAYSRLLRGHYDSLVTQWTVAALR